MLTETLGEPGTTLNNDEVRAFVVDHLSRAGLDGRSVCVLIPDGTRSCPLPLLLSAVHEALHGKVTRLTVLVALGTHAAMSDAELEALVGGTYDGMSVHNHEWWDPSTFVSVGTIRAKRVEELSGGLLRHSVDVRLNRAVVEHDVTLILGPVFP